MRSARIINLALAALWLCTAVTAQAGELMFRNHSDKKAWVSVVGKDGVTYPKAGKKRCEVHGSVTVTYDCHEIKNAYADIEGHTPAAGYGTESDLNLRGQCMNFNLQGMWPEFHPPHSGSRGR